MGLRQPQAAAVRHQTDRGEVIALPAGELSVHLAQARVPGAAVPREAGRRHRQRRDKAVPDRGADPDKVVCPSACFADLVERELSILSILPILSRRSGIDAQWRVRSKEPPSYCQPPLLAGEGTS
ncbi:hypothetical protein [Pannonibacter tanglangensis]|uniref:LysR substrate binding domain-containing protein n=1 Tax=Pannonibacter tanglangensis TaxID=2750084 RepID=A0ABW9ZNN6_9HYPH|nr:hypothetical protein [Pannonibacter sp. XCT-34]NBN65926.1 hypothetical protein [Pannonibacter sp. XCT-34]